MSRVRIDPTTSLDQQLAARIMERLVAEKLLSAREAKRLMAPLAEGELTADEWRLPLEVSDEAPDK